MTDTRAQARSEPRLRRAVTGKLLFLFILGDVLGAGIYALVGEIAAEVGGAIWLPLLVALVLALLTAGSYAELVTKYPRAGGAAVFAQRAYRNDLVGFLVGFCMLAAGVTSAAALALAFSGDYLQTFLDVPSVPAALVFLAVVAAVNARGIKESLGANVVMTCIELTGLVLVVVVAALVLFGGDGDVGRPFTFADGVSPVAGVVGAALLAFYSFVGFETSANLVEEVEDPSRTYPRALFGGLLVAGAMYVLVGLAASVVVDAETLSGSSGPLLEVVRASEVAIPDWGFSAVALVAVANGALLTMIMASRLVYGMAEQQLVPSVFGRVLPRRRTPWVAILTTTAIAMVLALTGDLADLAKTVVLLLLVVFLSTNVAVLVLRREEVDHDHARVPSVVPVLAVVSCIALLTQQEWAAWWRAGLMLALGAVLYAVARAGRRAESSASTG